MPKCNSLVIGAALAMAAGAMAQMPNTPMSTHDLGGGIYWIEGGAGANSGLILGAKGALLIDAKMTPQAGEALLAEIRKLSPNPVTHVILTHSDGDHVNGLAALPKGLTIIASDNCKREMQAALSDQRMPPPRDYLPTVTAAGNQSLSFEGRRIDVLYFGNAHTSGDVVVYLPERRIAFTGDLASAAGDPLIHGEKGGTSTGWVRVMKQVVTLDADTFVPGHGGLLKKADIERQIASTEAKQARVRELARQGKSLEEIKAALGESPATERSPGAAGRGMRFPTLVDVVYSEITAK
jgi:cyclase